jgi:hypothetical protein
MAFEYTIKGASSGKAPSVVATKGDDTFQLKRSNCILKTRSIIGLDPDCSDILGEFLASRVLKSMLPDEVIAGEKIELAPQVDLVGEGSHLLNSRRWQESINDIRITSRYFKHETVASMSFEDFLKKQGGERQKEYPTFIFQKEQANLAISEDSEQDAWQRQNKVILDAENEINLSGSQVKVKIDKKSFYDSLAASMILGDHDLEPGNFFVMVPKSGGIAKVGRIDMGHAFNDLVKNWGWGAHTPNQKHVQGRGVIRSMLNGDTINSNTDGKTKFLRNFGDGIVLDPEFADSLENMAEQQGKEMVAAIDKAVAEIESQYHSRGSRNKLFKAGKTLLHRMGVDPLETREVSDFSELCSMLKDECKIFIKTNREEAKSVAHMLRLQSAVEKSLLGSGKTAKEIIDLINKDPYLQQSFDQPVEWIRADQHSQPYFGTFAGYVQQREEALGVSKLHHKQKLPPLVKRDYSRMSLKQKSVLGLIILATSIATPFAPIAVVIGVVGALVFGLRFKVHNNNKLAEFEQKKKAIYSAGSPKKIDFKKLQQQFSRKLHLNQARQKRMGRLKRREDKGRIRRAMRKPKRNRV